MFCLTVAGIVIPVILLSVGIVALVLSLMGLLIGLLWPTLPIVLGLALIWRCAKRRAC